MHWVHQARYIFPSEFPMTNPLAIIAKFQGSGFVPEPFYAILSPTGVPLQTLHSPHRTLGTNTSSNQVAQPAPRAPFSPGDSTGRSHVSPFVWSIKALFALALFVTSIFYGLERLQLSRNEKLGIGHKMGKRAILYHANWVNYGRSFQVKDIPIKGVTDIAYAFFNLKDNGGGNWVIVSGDTYVSL